MQHADMTMLMSLALDGEASADETAKLQEHLRSCDTCARTWQRWQELDRRLSLAPVAPAPVDFTTSVTARLIVRQAEEARQRWFMLTMGVMWAVAVAITVLAFGISNGWHLQLVPDQGSLVAAWEGVVSTGEWLLRDTAGFVARVGLPTLAAVMGALLCLTCGLAVAWLWIVSRLTLSNGPVAVLATE